MTKKFDPTGTREAVDALAKHYENQLIEKVAEALAEASVPDRSGVPDLVPYGSAARTRPAWEREYQRQHWSDDYRKLRTPAKDLEAQEFCRALALGDWAKLREIESRRPRDDEERRWMRADLGSTTGAGLLPVGFRATIMRHLEVSAKIRAFATIVAGNEQTVKVPREGTKMAGGMFAEGADMTAGITEPTFTSVTLAADQKLGIVFKASRELLDDSPLLFVNTIAQQAGEQFGQMEDARILATAGFTSNLSGAATLSTVLMVDAPADSAAALTKLHDIVYALGEAARRFGVFILNETAAKNYGKIAATDGRPVFLELNPPPTPVGDFGGPAVGRLMGFPTLVYPVGSGTVPSNTCYFGDLRGVAIYDREFMRAEQSPDRYFETDQVALKFVRRVDAAVVQASRVNKHPAA
jgi:HK97 family phage major capsid protein